MPPKTKKSKDDHGHHGSKKGSKDGHDHHGCKKSKDGHDHHGCGCSSFKFCTKILNEEFGGSIFKDLTDQALKTLKDEITSGLSEPTIYMNGTVRTMSKGDTSHVAEAMAVDEHGTIQAIGTLSECRDAMEATREYDLKGGYVYPGFIDSHIHLLSAALESIFIDVAPIDQDTQYLRADYNMDSCFKKIKQDMKHLDVKNAILVMGMDPSLFVTTKDGTLTDDWEAPTEGHWKTLIDDDASAEEVPIVIMNASMHVAYLNEAALDLCEIEGNTTGIVLESDALNAAGKIVTTIYETDKKNFVTHMLQGICRKLGQASAAGITTWWDAVLSSSGKVGELDVLKVIGELGPVRYGGGLGYFSEDDLNKWPDINPTTYSSEKFRVKCAKIVSDGSNQGLSGYQSQKYPNPDENINVEGSECGVWNIADKEFKSMVKTLDNAGWACMVHANGDAAIEQTLEAFRVAKDTKKTTDIPFGDRHRIEHCSFFPAPKDGEEDPIEKMATIGVHPSFLIGHVGYWGACFQQKIFPTKTEELNGKSQRLDMFRSSLDKGLRCTLHSDHTVTPLGPLRMIEQAVGRKMERGTSTGKSDYGTLNPGQCITMAEAIKAVTYDAAWQCHYDDITGSLEVGKKADFVVFDQDLMADGFNIEGLRQLPIRETWMNGIKRHDARNTKKSFI